MSACEIWGFTLVTLLVLCLVAIVIKICINWR